MNCERHGMQANTKTEWGRKRTHLGYGEYQKLNEEREEPPI